LRQVEEFSRLGENLPSVLKNISTHGQTKIRTELTNNLARGGRIQINDILYF
jgi:hypothetical protein